MQVDEFLHNGVIIDADPGKVRKIMACTLCGMELCEVDGSGDTLYLLAAKLAAHKPACTGPREIHDFLDTMLGQGTTPHWWQLPTGMWVCYYPQFPDEAPGTEEKGNTSE